MERGVSENWRWAYEGEAKMRYGVQENHLRAWMRSTAEIQRRARLRSGIKEMLLRHYVKGAPHPFDENRPLNEWDKTD